MSAEERYRADTLFDLYRAVWRVTGRQQLLLIGLSVTVAALAAARHGRNRLAEFQTGDAFADLIHDAD